MPCCRLRGRTLKSSPSEAFIFTMLGRKEVYFAAEMLSTVGDGWTADI
jgi:hypothetical protein